MLKIVKGEWGSEVKFCPRPPELATMVRKEEMMINLLREPKPSNSPVKNPTMVSHMQKRWEGKKAIGTNIEMKDFKARPWPKGSVYVPILSTVFAEGEMSYTKLKD